MSTINRRLNNKNAEQNDKSLVPSVLSHNYCLVDYDTLSVFAEVSSEELSRISTLNKIIKEFKPFRYRLSGNDYRKCLAIRNEVIKEFISTAEEKSHWRLYNQSGLKMLKLFSMLRKRHMRILLGSFHIDIAIFPAAKIELDYTSMRSAYSQSSISRRTNYEMFDNEILKEYDGLKALLMEKNLRGRFETSPKQKASNLMLHLNEYWDKHLTREQASRFIDQELLSKFDNTPNEEKYNFIKEIGKEFFV
jgi:hypothetical protein